LQAQINKNEGVIMCRDWIQLRYSSLIIFLLCFGFNFDAKAQFFGEENMNPMDHGPFVSSTITDDPNSAKGIFVYKGIAVKVDSDPDATMVFDSDLLRVAGAWTGGFLHWYPARDGLQEWPTPDGIMHFETSQRPGWTTGNFNDPRPWGYGPLPKDWGEYKGFFQHGKEVVFSFTVGSNSVLEKFDFKRVRTQPVFIRTINITPENNSESLSMHVVQVPEGSSTNLSKVMLSESSGYVKVQSGNEARLIGFRNLPEAAEWRLTDYHLILDLPELNQKHHFEIGIGPILSRLDTRFMHNYLEKAPSADEMDLEPFTEPSSAQWEIIETEAVMGSGSGAFVVDDLTLPTSDNPWNSHIRLSDIDFLSDGRAVVASLSGEVWLVDGIAETLGTLRWHRFATGLNQPLGVRVVDDQIYVTGRDQITILHDRNGNGEADFYENFNNEVMAATNFHAFTMNLETDADGNFYFAKATPWPPVSRGEMQVPAEVTPHHGVLFKLSPDGEDLEIIATGLRNPNGMGISPEGEIVYADNEGNWVPTSKVHRIREGGFHGFVPSAHLEGPIPGFPRVPAEEDFIKPITWTPHYIDNSPAKPTFITSEDWPDELQGHLLLASYGRGHLSLLLNEEVDGQWQAAHMVLPLDFNSGLERGRFHEDGHFYLAGLTSWQSVGHGGNWGSLHRVRYTGQSLNMPVEVNTRVGGLELRFSDELDPGYAVDAQNYNLEKWTYTWNSSYGSRQGLFSVDNPGETGQDSVNISSIRLSEDRKSVFIEIPGFEAGPVKARIPILDNLPHQIEANLGIIMSIEYNIRTATGVDLDHLIHKTIHRVPSENFEAAR
jgi:glucose/arabinose dehydrogenase